MNSIQDDYITYIKNHIRDKKALLLFFNATWCKPCKKVKELIQPSIPSILKNNTDVIFIDIDTHKDSKNKNNADFFTFLKQKRIVRGVPSLLLYTSKDDSDYTLYPDFFCDTNVKHITELLTLINKL